MSQKEYPPNNNAFANPDHQNLMYGYDQTNTKFRMVRVDEDGCLLVADEPTRQANGTPTTGGATMHTGSGIIKAISNSSTNIITISDNGTTLIHVAPSIHIGGLRIPFDTNIVATSVGAVLSGGLTILYA